MRTRTTGEQRILMMTPFKPNGFPKPSFSKPSDKDEEDEDEDLGPTKEDRIKRFINSEKDKKKVGDKEQPMKGVKKKPFRPRIEWDEEEDYGYLEET